MLEAYTDGSCIGNPGKGAWAIVFIDKGKTFEFSEGYRYTTNNRMELMAVYNAIKIASQKKRKELTIYSDSQLIVDAINKNWLSSWKKKNWKKSDGKKVLNQDLWSIIDQELQKLKIVIKKVPAHSGIEFNELCDQLAKDATLNEKLLIDTEYEITAEKEIKIDFDSKPETTKTNMEIINHNNLKSVRITQGNKKIIIEYSKLKEFMENNE